MIELLFTTTDLPFSRFERWLTATDCSHFALLMDKKLVFHSDLRGCHLEPLEIFLKRNRVIHSLVFKDYLRPSVEEALYQKLIKLDYGKPFDYGALLFLGFNIIAKRLFNKAINKNNLWQSKEAHICTEVLRSLSGFNFGAFTFPVIEKINMSTVHDLYLELSCLPQLEPTAF